MSYSGLGQQSSSISEPPKDPISPLVPVVPMTPGLYTTSSQQAALAAQQARAAAQQARTAATRAPVSSWRMQIERMLQAAAVMIMSLPESIVTQLWTLLRGLATDAQHEIEVLFRAFADPTVTDTQVAEKMKSVSDRYRSMRPSIPGPAVVVIDPIIDSAWRLVPLNVRPAGTVQVESVTPVASALDSVPWLWAAGSFVAGLAACAVFGGKKTTPNRRVRRMSRNASTDVHHPTGAGRTLRWTRGHSGTYHTPTEMFDWDPRTGKLRYNYEVQAKGRFRGNDPSPASRILGTYRTLQAASARAFKTIDQNRARNEKRWGRR